VLRSAKPAAVAERIERAQALDGPVSALSGIVVRALPPGRRADALHGVPLGQPAHPALVQLPVGYWTSAVLLDQFGGRGAERAAATLIAAGLAAAVPAAATGAADWSALHSHQQRVGLVHAITQAGATALFAGSLLARAAGQRGRVTSAGGAGCVTCPWHGSTFRLDNGAVRHGPATARQPAFETRVSDSGLVQVRPQEPPGGTVRRPRRGGRHAARDGRTRSGG
jgi:hypothetical protein